MTGKFRENIFEKWIAALFQSENSSPICHLKWSFSWWDFIVLARQTNCVFSGLILFYCSVVEINLLPLCELTGIDFGVIDVRASTLPSQFIRIKKACTWLGTIYIDSIKATSNNTKSTPKKINDERKKKCAATSISSLRTNVRNERLGSEQTDEFIPRCSRICHIVIVCVATAAAAAFKLNTRQK